MLVLGLILLLLAAALLVGFLLSGTQEVTFDSDVLGVTVNTLTIYLLGALTLLLVVAGLSLMRSGVRRANQHRKERKELSRLSQQEERQGAAPRASGTAVSGDTAPPTTTATPTATHPVRDDGTGGEGSHRT